MCINLKLIKPVFLLFENRMKISAFYYHIANFTAKSSVFSENKEIYYCSLNIF